MSMVSLPWGGSISFFAFCVTFGALVACVWTVYRAHKFGAGDGSAIFFSALSGALGLLLGRAVFCAVRFDDLFYDPMGDFMGFSPFLDLNQGSLNVIGAILGVLLAALLVGAVSGKSGLALLDSAAVPGLAFFAWVRLVEPLGGTGFGDTLTNEAFCRVPFAIENSWGAHLLSVCFIEAVLAALITLALLIAGRFCRKKGTLGGIALALLCVSQIMPDSLRHDDALFLFTFARVSQMGYGVLLLGVLVGGLIRGGKRGLGAKTIVLEIILLLLGVGVLVGAEFALDKTNWPDEAVYAGMIAALLCMGFLVVRRLVKEDRVPRAVPAPEADPADEEAEETDGEKAEA